MSNENTGAEKCPLSATPYVIPVHSFTSIVPKKKKRVLKTKSLKFGATRFAVKPDQAEVRLFADIILTTCCEDVYIALQNY